MQATTDRNSDFAALFKRSLSAPRFGTYLSAADNDDANAINLYQWNSRISQSFYIYLQSWEICLRNKLNAFLIWKYNEGWPYESNRVLRNMKGDDRRRLQETISRQERARKISPVPTSIIVADLSAGFWVSQISVNYEVHYQWRYNLNRIFPHAKLARADAWKICEDLLILRNRIAHHEPVFHLPLEDRRKQLADIVAAMCPATTAFSEATCNFDDVWKQRPQNASKPDENADSR